MEKPKTAFPHSHSPDYWINIKGEKRDFFVDQNLTGSVYRPSNQTWYRIHTDNFAVIERQWGLANDIPAPGDFDGDGKLDITVYRPSEGKWYVLTASQAILSQTFGLNGDLPTENAFVY